MSEIINIYCDESCHLEHDRQTAMVLGAVWCPARKVRRIHERLREIMQRHGLSRWLEIKWGSVSASKAQFFLDLLDYFFDEADLHFRAVIIPDKSKLNHAAFNHTHDTFYYKMYFDLLKFIIDPTCSFNIYLDIKDTWGRRKVAKLHEVLSNNNYDFRRQIIRKIQTVRSHEVELVQLADLLIGAISYVNRGLATSEAKLQMVQRMQRRSGKQLTKTTLLRESKVNLLRWQAGEVG